MRLLVGLLYLAGIFGAADSSPGPEPQDLEILKKHQVAADAPGLLKYLRSLQRGEEQSRQVQALIVQLGSAAYKDRVAAGRKLAILGLVVVPELREAVEKPPNEEVRRRAEVLLQKIEAEGETVFLAVLNVIQAQPPEGAALELLKLMPAFDDEHLRRALRETLLSASRPGDADVLRSGLKTQQGEVRLAVFTALEKVLGVGVVADARALLQDRDERVKLEAARALVRHTPRECLQPLVVLLESEVPQTRTEANRLLRALTGQDFHFAGYDPPEQRRQAVESWRAWVRQHGKTAELRRMSVE